MSADRKIGVSTFSFPGDETLYEELVNSENVDVIDEIKVACPKEMCVIFIVKYEKYI